MATIMKAEKVPFGKVFCLLRNQLLVFERIIGRKRRFRGQLSIRVKVRGREEILEKKRSPISLLYIPANAEVVVLSSLVSQLN